MMIPTTRATATTPPMIPAVEAMFMDATGDGWVSQHYSLRSVLDEKLQCFLRGLTRRVTLHDADLISLVDVQM